MTTSLLGVGLYTIPEAARLLRAKKIDVHRWMFGYDYNVRGEKRHQDPVVGEQLTLDSTKALTFHDLLEVRFVNALRGCNVSLQAIRKAAANARELFNTKHPFVLRRIETDGRTIFAKAADDTDDEALLDLVKRQYGFRRFLAESIIKGIEFDDDVACRWYPLDHSKAIVLDPERSFGRPIVSEFGVPTWVLHEAYLAENKDRARVARIYEVTPRAVDQAVQFESARLH